MSSSSSVSDMGFLSCAHFKSTPIDEQAMKTVDRDGYGSRWRSDAEVRSGLSSTTIGKKRKKKKIPNAGLIQNGKIGQRCD